MKPLKGQFFVLLLLTLSLPAISQPVQRPSFRAVVHLKDGGRISGVLNDVQNGVIEFVPYERIYYRHVEYGLGSVALAGVDRVFIKRTDKRQAIRTGAIVGGLLGAYLAYRSIQRNGFRSPILGGVSIALSAGALGATGALTGSLIGGSNRRLVRPIDRENPAESLERQLRPFTRVYIEDIPLEIQ